MFARTKYVAAGLTGSLLFATVAFAQTPTTTGDKTDMKADSTSTSAAATDNTYHGDWRTSKVVGLSVYNDENESVGSISDLLTDKTGNIKAAVISVGGVLGVGSHLVAVPFDKVKFVNEPVAYTGVAGGATGAPGAPGTPGAGSTHPSSTMTTGAATSNSTAGSSGAGMASASKPNPWYPDHAVYNATKDQLKAMPEFKYAE